MLRAITRLACAEIGGAVTALSGEAIKAHDKLDQSDDLGQGGSCSTRSRGVLC